MDLEFNSYFVSSNMYTLKR